MTGLQVLYAFGVGAGAILAALVVVAAVTFVAVWLAEHPSVAVLIWALLICAALAVAIGAAILGYTK